MSSPSSIGSDSDIDEVVSDSTTPPMKKHKTHKKKVKKHSHALKRKIKSKVVEMDTDIINVNLKS